MFSFIWNLGILQLGLPISSEINPKLVSFQWTVFKQYFFFQEKIDISFGDDAEFEAEDLVAGFTENLKKEGVKVKKGDFSKTWQKQGHTA